MQEQKKQLFSFCGSRLSKNQERKIQNRVGGFFKEGHHGTELVLVKSVTEIFDRAILGDFQDFLESTSCQRVLWRCKNPSFVVPNNKVALAIIEPEEIILPFETLRRKDV